jgi:hypothetical protein
LGWDQETRGEEVGAGRSLLEMISKESGVEGREIDDLKMMDDFSFISVSPRNAEIIT